jgi:hypothetical protein
MATRSVKMYGKVYGENVSLQASFNNVEIVNGTVASTNTAADQSVAWADMDAVVEFTLDDSVTGDVPFTATVTGGTFVFHTFHATHCGDIPVRDGDGNPVSPRQVATASADNWDDISFGAVDPDTGHNNIVIAGESRTRDLVASPDLTGPWNWTIEDGETMSMNIAVSPLPTP